MTDASGAVRPHWRHLAEQSGHWTLDERAALAGAASRMIEDLGTTFNVFSDVGGAGQPYQMDVLPLLVPREEWETVSAGLAQRIRLIDAVLADLYGPQTLLQAGLIPPDLVHSNPAFLHPVAGIHPPGGRHVVTTGCDLVRTPAGVWTVLADHAGVPRGLGQVLENRNVTSNLLAESFAALGVARLGDFNRIERATLQDLAQRRGEEANMVFLTPGFRHPSYFEHAYKARLLGFPLVEPADLTVRERRLFLKTLGGLRRIDGMICRIEGGELDPLMQWQGGDTGVPGLIEAWRSGNVALVNAPGASFASSPALMPFLPRVCAEWFGEELRLPFVETWWLGQKEVRDRVLGEMQRFVLLSATPHAAEAAPPAPWAMLSASARRQWLAAIEQRPHDFVVQALVRPGEAPSLQARTLRPQPLVWRAFALYAAEGPVVMPGGMARVGKAGHAPQLWPDHAGFTKDVWITGMAGAVPAFERPMARPAGSQQGMATEVPSRLAEQLYWVGRYAERIELATRMLRVTLGCFASEAGRPRDAELAVCRRLLKECGFLPDGAAEATEGLFGMLAGLIHDPAAAGGIPALTRSLRINAAAARDRLSDDTWRFFNRIEGVISQPQVRPLVSDLQRTLDSLILHLAAFAGMQNENMTRGHGWRFLEVGRRVERGIGVLNLLRAACGTEQGAAAPLGPLLEICDSVMTYRRRHFSRPDMGGVVDLVFFDRGNPRALAYQARVIQAESGHFPGRAEYGLLPRLRAQAGALDARFDDPRRPDAAEFARLVGDFEAFSDSLTEHYFSHSVRKVY
jgi:uncharacterized circularly permuted ATP-grasp superfamily protein/uncharacterized alpha-E superfamily protein